MIEDKIISYEDAPAVFDELRKQNKTIVQCHGTFDLVHPGHLYHLEEAKALGDILVCTITGEAHVNKGPGRPYFNDHLRSKALASLTYVDYVVVVPFPAAVEAIKCVKPRYYCKGREYEDQNVDVTGNIHNDVETVHQYGGEMRYVGSVVFSSTKLLNNFFDNLPAPVKDFCHTISSKTSPDQFREVVESFEDIKVLVIGDVIFDRYSYVKVQGLTSKNRILSGRYLHEDTQSGGALAVVRHIKQFCKQVDLISILGTEPWVDDMMSQDLEPESNLTIRSEEFTTVLKQRYVEPTGDGKELNKLFSVNYIDAEFPSEPLQRQLLSQIEKYIDRYDVIVVTDFGHGVMQPMIREFVQECAPFMALNCQTNSNNHGFNIISKQYHRANVFTLDEQELLLSCAHRHVDHVAEMKQLRNSFNSSYAWLTRGPVETIGVNDRSETCVCQPLETTVVDTVGAGDAFFSLALLAAYRKLPLSLATFLGQLAGGQAVRIIGNVTPISKPGVLKSGMSLLNF